MRSSRSRSLAAALLAAIPLFTAAGCVAGAGSAPTAPTQAQTHGPPAHAPAHGWRRKHAYVHYPSCNVYYDRERRLYFWLEGRDWKVGVELPGSFRIDVRAAVTIELDSDVPYDAEPHGKGKGK